MFEFKHPNFIFFSLFFFCVAAVHLIILRILFNGMT